MSRPAPEALRVAETARTIALQMMSERGRGAVLVGGPRRRGIGSSAESSIGSTLGARDPLPHRSTSWILRGPDRTGSATWPNRQTG